MTADDNPRIAVVGDVTVDWMVLAPSGVGPSTLQTTYQWEAGGGAGVASQPGGAALIAALVVAAGNERTDRLTSRGPAVPPDALVDPGYSGLPRTFAVWQPFPVALDEPRPAWRMAQFLGLQRPTESALQWERTPPSDDPACLMVDDANLGFRDRTDVWPACLVSAEARPKHVILRQANPLAAGPLWRALVEHCGDRLTVCCSVGDLRKEDAPIGQALSWERMGSEVVAAVRAREPFADAQRVIVTVGLAGAVLVPRTGPATLIFDPLHQEGDWHRSRPGTPFGIGTAVAASLAIAAAERPEDADWAGAVRRGLQAARVVHLGGFALTGGDGAPALRFPLETAATLLGTDAPETPFETVEIWGRPEWQIFTSAVSEDYGPLARRIVEEGEREACHRLPLERMGRWVSVDRTEIESMRSVREIIREYLAQPRPPRPLSLAVFGPPGAGKSFAIKQMAREWMAGGTRVTVLEFNLSQFGSHDLAGALQRVRDCTVERALPLVFWDEFDAAPGGHELGWLAQFLAPMQDGTFVEDGVVRPIGPAIFVFAGGTHPTLAGFKARAVALPGAKATDFLSRLRGFVDILGPNPAGPDDASFMPRRALLLRALLRGRAPQLFARERLRIDPGVLRAFLEVASYVHGARSMEAILDMSGLSGKLRYERSALPPAHQLGLHVDAEEFLGLVHRSPAPSG
ncbi:MAG TPA: AAA family ATPase [Thermomicrobiaceae bacterium]|nr:AAA family ATPase [Thermomicrobiaceae bacterium]